MRVVFAITAFVALAAAHHGGPHVIPELFEGQHQYVYNYRSLVATGLPLQSQRYAGLEKYGVLTVQVQEQQGNTKVLGFRLGHVTSGSFDKEVEDIENRRIEGVSHATEETIEKYGPVFVRYQDNVVQKLKVPEGMPEEVVNIYRGIAAVFTVGKPETHGGEPHPFMYQGGQGHHGDYEPTVYRRQEQGINGNFETTYEVLGYPDQYNNHFNLTKTRNYMKYLGRDGRFFQNGHDERGCHNVCPTHKPEQLDSNLQPEGSAWEKPVPEGCPVNFHPKKELVEAFTTYNYNMTVQKGGKYAVIEGVQALDKKILPLRRQQIQTVSLLKLTFVEERTTSQPWQQQGATKQYDDITYRFPEGHKFDLQYLSLYNKANNGDMLKEQILPMIKYLAEVIVSDNIELKSQTGDKVVQITMALGALHKQGLHALWTAIGQPVSGKTGTDFEKVQRKVLIDTIGLSGSNEAAEFLLELIHQQQLSTLETVDTLETLQKNLVRPTTKVMNQLLQLITDGKFQEKRTIFSTGAIAFAEIVRGNCGNYKTYQWQKDQQQDLKERTGGQGEVHYCGQQEYKQFVDTIRGQLHSAKTFAQQTVFIQTLGRLAHPEAIKALIPYVYGEQEVIAQVEKMTRHDEHEDNSEYVQFLRQVAIYALHHAAKHHGAAIQPIVQGIYFNRQEDYEIRVAALSVLLATQPTQATFGRMVIELGTEEDYEVASYAYSALRSIANSTLPCLKQTARRVRNVLGALPQRTYGAQRSKWGGYTQYFPLAQFGLKGHYELTQSNVSAVPRFFYGGLTANKGPFVSTLGDFGMITKGLENFGQYIHGKGGMNKIVDNVMQRIRREARTYGGDETVQKMIEQIENAMQFNIEENNEQPRAVFFGNVLGNELYLPVDKEYITKVAQTAGERIVNILREDGSEKTFRYVRVFMPRTYVQVAPGVNGLPVLLSNRHPIVVSLALKDLQTRFGPEKGQVKLNPFVAAVSAFIQPTVYHTSIHSALTINPTEQSRVAYGVRAVEQTYLTFPFDASVQYTHPTKTFAFSFRPRFEKLFYHKTRAMTFKTEALLIRDVEKPLLESFTTVKTQQKPFSYERVFGEKIGMPIRVQGMSMNEEYAVNFFNNRDAREENIMTALIKLVNNEWYVPRTWAVRVDQGEKKPIEEVKMIVRLGNFLKDRLHQEQKEQKPMKQLHLSKAQLDKEESYPEHMRMIAYDDEYEKITGRKPDGEKLEQALDRIVKKTEKYWSQVERELGQKFNKENVQVRSVEYILAAFGQKKQTSLTGHLILGSTLSKQAKVAELKMNLEGRPFYFEAQGVAAFTKAPQPFETEVREQEQRGIVGFVAELETRQTGKQHYAGKIEMDKSNEQKQLMRRSVEQKPWFYRQCEEDKKEHMSEMSSACEIARYHKSALNHLRFEIELPEQIHERLVNASHKAREALKVRLYRNLRATYGEENTKTQENKIQGELIYSERYPAMRMANLTILTPDHQELRFERFTLPKAFRPNTMWSLKQQIKAFARNGRPEPVCVYNGHQIRTFDNVTVSLEAMKEGEKYVIARDNDEKPKFTILAEKKQSGEKTEVELILRDATYIKLVPGSQQGQYKVRVNQTELEVSPQEGEVRRYAGWGKHVITFHVQEHKEGQDTLVLKVRDQRMRIVYDGKNLKVEMAKRQAKGQLTGLCGDMNNQHLDELTGPRGCNFELEEDFVRAFGLDKNHGEQMEGSWTCPEGVYPRGASQADITKRQQGKHMMHQKKQDMIQMRHSLRQQHEQMTEETKMIPLGSRICFSVDPVPTCKPGSRQTQSQMQTVAFSCLPANSQRALQLQREVQTQKIAMNLPTFSARSGLVHHQIEVAIRCSQ